jgi:hypothetical protein
MEVNTSSNPFCRLYPYPGSTPYRGLQIERGREGRVKEFQIQIPNSKA